jgi:hypothetical protein
MHCSALSVTFIRLRRISATDKGKQVHKYEDIFKACHSGLDPESSFLLSGFPLEPALEFRNRGRE